MVGKRDRDERRDKEMTGRYKSWEHTKIRDRKTITVENRGREPWQDKPDTMAGGSFDRAVAELVDAKLEDEVEKKEQIKGKRWQNWVNRQEQEESEQLSIGDGEREQALEDSSSRSDSD